MSKVLTITSSQICQKSQYRIGPTGLDHTRIGKKHGSGSIRLKG
ncbi:MAG: hypothetical protein ACTS3T_20745 [Almyronema sp.]